MIFTIIEYLVLFFFLLLISLHVNNYFVKNVEPLTNHNNQLKYTETNLNNDALYLAKTNAANISYLKNRVDEMFKTLNRLDIDNTTIKKSVEKNTELINNTNNALSSSANNALPSKKNYNDLVNQ